MAKYIDSNESRRLSRLKTIKSSLSSKTSHSGWQKAQIEKRRKEQLRQRKESKKKPIGNGIQVDVSVSKSDAVSKSGLKLKVTTENSGKVNNVSKQKTQIKPKALVEPSSQKQSTNKPVSFPLNRRRYAPKKKQDSKNVESAKLPLLKDKVSNIGKKPNKQQPTKQLTKQLATVSHNSIKSNKPSNSQKLYGPSQRRVAEDKENSDNSSSKKETHPKKSQQVIAPKKSVTTTTSPKKEYFMDIHSLRREHADALKMLEELDKKEGQQRRSLESADNPSSADDINYVPLGIRRNQNSERDSYDSINNTLDDEFVRDCSSRSTSYDDVAPATVTDSFLNMTHLSISLRDDFDTDGGIDKSERSQSLTPNRNRSFASSCASVEENSDLFGDADVDSYSSNEDDNYSDGTF